MTEPSCAAPPFHRWAQCPKTDALPRRAWLVLDDDVSLLRALCDDAVQQASTAPCRGDRAAAHLCRAILCWPLLPQATLEEDVAAWKAREDTLEGGTAISERLCRLGIAAGGFLLRREGRHAAALACFESMAVRSTGMDADPDDHFILYGRGLSAVSQSRFDVGLESLQQALELAERMSCKVRICSVATALGSALSSVGRYAEKLELLESILMRDILPSANPRLTLMIRANHALALSDLGHSQRAFDALALLQPAVEADAPGMLKLLFQNLCELSIDLGLRKEAGRYLDMAYEQAYLCRDDSNVGVCHVDAGRLAHMEGRGHDAIQALLLADECRRACPEGNGPLNEIDHWLSLCYADLGRFDLAYRHQCLHHHAHVKRAADAELGILAARGPGAARQATADLSARELECLRWCVAGKTAWETGEILGLSEWTVVYHLGKARRKMGVTSKQQLVALAVSQGLAAGTDARPHDRATRLHLARSGRRHYR